MNTDTISRWLQSPASLPDEAEIKSLLQSSPWFVPARLMEAVQQHRRSPFSPQSLSLIHLYGPDWASAYRLLSAVGETPVHNHTQATGIDPVQHLAAHDSEREASAPEAQHDSPAAQVDAPVIIQPPYTEDYFQPEKEEPTQPATEAEDPKTLMVMMSFAEWLSHFKTRSEREEEEARDKSALRSMWQQEKLAAALEDEPEEIPEDVFEMAVSSITREDDLASESLADILEKQGKWSAAAEMYRKLGLRNPAKSGYFASRAEAAKKRSL
jgi:hypothetical protein